MKLKVSCELDFDIETPTPFVFMLRPRSGALQWVVRDEFRLTPEVTAFEFTDGYGNLCQRLTAPAGPFQVETLAEVVTSPETDRQPGAPFVEIQFLPDAVMSYILPSRYCESDRLFERTMDVVGSALPGYDQVAAIESWLREQVSYVPGSSEIPNSALEILAAGRGVCRDLSHLGIAMCRSISIPSRLVVGYLHELEPMDMHAWFEAYVGGRWFTFDATQQALPGGYVPLAYGRDAADVALYTQFGTPVPLKRQVVSVVRLEDEA